MSETKGETPEIPRGAQPKIQHPPIRKRAFHRALKRGECWAQMKDSMNKICAHLAKQLYNPDDTLKPCKLIGLLPREDE